MTAQVIDIDALLAPISDESPAGVDPRADGAATSLYYRTKDARNAARSTERASVEIGAPPPDEWSTVQETAMELLATQGKDLEIAAWLVEALVRLEGFPGLRDGFKVLAGIASTYWEGCFPELDEEDGVEGKVSPVSGLNGAGATGTLIQPIRLIPLTRGSLASYSLWSYEQANDLEKIADPTRKQERIDNGSVTMDQFTQSVAETSAADLHATATDVDECLAALAEMSAAFDAVAGVDAPPVSALRELLGEISSSIRHFASDKLATMAYVDTGDDAAGEASVAEAGAEGGTAAAAPVRRTEGYGSREDALQELVKIAAYFRKTEPHSPISYTLEDAVRRARMTLPELLTELAEDPAHIQRILMAAGIKSAAPEAADGY
ncbi:type VI secretion system protein TssA [Mesorhizobium sp. CAU 1741]|uniref:type VI secretion system protein TssA n=1 Tax=Mesorhizobium sp. CAU 1741 TaxID=3140366 RepID=UPI00325BA8D3